MIDVFLENRTYDQIKVGDTASLERGTDGVPTWRDHDIELLGEQCEQNEEWRARDTEVRRRCNYCQAIDFIRTFVRLSDAHTPIYLKKEIIGV